MTPDIDLVEHWGIRPRQVEEFFPVGANPMRRSRTWLLDNTYLLRSEPVHLFREKEPVAKLVSVLDEQGIPVLLPKKNKTVRIEDSVYQLFDYVHQRNEGRLDVRNEPGKAETVGAVLASISNLKVSPAARDLIRNHPSIRETTESTLSRIRTDDEKTERILAQARTYLERSLFPFLPYLEKRFGHGDIHPGNILWDRHHLHAVIDWEQAGIREELYDLAFLVGCVGMDEPAELKGSWVRSLIRTYLSHTKTTKLSFELLFELVLAIRIQWLFVWLSLPDHARIAELEAEYWETLMGNREEIRSAWGSWADADFKYSERRWVMQDAWMVEEIEKAKQRLAGRNILDDKLEFETRSEAEQMSTDLRLMAIEFGMNDDIRSVCKVLDQQEQLSEKNPESTYIKIEQVLTRGNAALDFSKFRMVRAMDYILWECERLMRSNPGVDELKIGYAFAIRNASILFAELNESEKSMRLVEKHIRLAEENPLALDIQEELARSLSNAVTSILGQGGGTSDPDRLQTYSRILYELLSNHPDSKKIKAAYSIAKANMRKAGMDGP